MLQIMAGGELTLKTITADAENELQNTWSFCLECDQTSIGTRQTNPQSILNDDRLKGQDPTLRRWFPHAGIEDCVFHLKESKNGHANLIKMALFDQIIYSATIAEAHYHKTNFLHEARAPVGNYVNDSIFQGNSSLARFCDAVIMNGDNEREQEGVHSSQGSESFHSTNIEERSHPLTIYLADVYGKQYEILHRLLIKYKGYHKKSMRLPPSKQDEMDTNTGDVKNSVSCEQGISVQMYHVFMVEQIHMCIVLTCNQFLLSGMQWLYLSFCHSFYKKVWVGSG
jgi:hypothetical protein